MRRRHIGRRSRRRLVEVKLANQSGELDAGFGLDVDRRMLAPALAEAFLENKLARLRDTVPAVGG
jgi:hypothetical protein